MSASTASCSRPTSRISRTNGPIPGRLSTRSMPTSPRTTNAGSGPGTPSSSSTSPTERLAATRLFDDLIGAGEDRGRHSEAERLGGIEIDHQLEGCWLLDRQIGGLLALKYPSGVNAGPPKEIVVVSSIADQATGGDGFTLCVDRRNNMARRQRHNLISSAKKEIGV